MLESRLSSSGAVIQTTEQVVQTVQPASGGDVIQVTLPVLSRLGVGCMVSVIIDESVPNVLLLSAGVTAVGTVVVNYYVIIEITNPTQFQFHVQISAHNLSEVG